MCHWCVCARGETVGYCNGSTVKRPAVVATGRHKVQNVSVMVRRAVAEIDGHSIAGNVRPSLISPPPPPQCSLLCQWGGSPSLSWSKIGRYLDFLCPHLRVPQSRRRPPIRLFGPMVALQPLHLALSLLSLPPSRPPSLSLSLSLSRSLRSPLLSASLSPSLTLSLSLSLFSLSLSLSLSLPLALGPSLHRSLHLSICQYVGLSVCLSVCPAPKRAQRVSFPKRPCDRSMCSAVAWHPNRRMCVQCEGTGSCANLMFVDCTRAFSA